MNCPGKYAKSSRPALCVIRHAPIRREMSYHGVRLFKRPRAHSSIQNGITMTDTDVETLFPEPLDDTPWDEIAENSWFCGVYRYRFDCEALIRKKRHGALRVGNSPNHRRKRRIRARRGRHIRELRPGREKGSNAVCRVYGPAFGARPESRRRAGAACQGRRIAASGAAASR